MSRVTTDRQGGDSECSTLRGFDADDNTDSFDVFPQKKPQALETQTPKAQNRPQKKRTCSKHQIKLRHKSGTFPSKLQEKIAANYLRVPAKAHIEHIPLLDDSDCSDEEHQAKLVLETLHLKFRGQKTPSMEKQSVEKPKETNNTTPRKRLKQGKLSQEIVSMPLTPILKSWKSIFTKRTALDLSATHNFWSTPQSTITYHATPRKRTIDRGAFLIVSSERSSKEFGNWTQALKPLGSRPISARFPIRKTLLSPRNRLTTR